MLRRLFTDYDFFVVGATIVWTSVITFVTQYEFKAKSIFIPFYNIMGIAKMYILKSNCS